MIRACWDCKQVYLARPNEAEHIPAWCPLCANKARERDKLAYEAALRRLEAADHEGRP